MHVFCERIETVRDEHKNDGDGGDSFIGSYMADCSC